MRRVGKIASHGRWNGREVERDFAHAVCPDERARVGMARKNAPLPTLQNRVVALWRPVLQGVLGAFDHLGRGGEDPFRQGLQFLA